MPCAERARIAPRLCTPARFASFLQKRWAEGERNVRRLLQEIRNQGYTGCFSRLAAFVAKWRQKLAESPEPPPPREVLPLDARTGAVISPVVTAALCIKPRCLLTTHQAGKVDVLKRALPMFARMRSLAMRFRGLMRGGRSSALLNWIWDAMASGVPTMRIFAGKLRHDIDAVRNAIHEKWSNGQTEGQVNRLKPLKHAMFGRASVKLLSARMRPLCEFEQHQD